MGILDNRVLISVKSGNGERRYFNRITQGFTARWNGVGFYDTTGRSINVYFVQWGTRIPHGTSRGVSRIAPLAPWFSFVCQWYHHELFQYTTESSQVLPILCQPLVFYIRVPRDCARMIRWPALTTPKSKTRVLLLTYQCILLPICHGYTLRIPLKSFVKP